MNKTDLQEIKKGKDGYGLLVETDGYISLSEDRNKILRESMGDGDNWHCPYPFKVFAVLQKCDTENANGRIYPKAVLMKEAEKYQDLIRDRRSFGECYTPDTLILTAERGWQELKDVVEGEDILTLNKETKNVEIKPIKRVIKYHYKGKMIVIRGKNIDDFVTPKHKFPIYDVNHRYKGDFTALDLIDGSDITASDYIPTMEGYDIVLDNLEFRVQSYDDDVMCVEVENHSWYCNCGGFRHWTCNCNHPSDSTINLSRVSHIITEMHWEGKTLVGELELNVSRGFVKNGIVTTCGDEAANLLLNGYKIGVSSRGVGSVENKFGKMIVGDDFELICVDIVATPSTPNAYIGSTPTELQGYIESKENKKPILSEKLEKIKKILK